ncbi:Mu transposase C-terminal domain-containing protein [Kitasatospora kifunensis]|uniref:Transposase InsO family protein n=1 Tax=Kitasatospora kifunensis TaxID=58351 RepID=A0A7W7VU64_KITKI|nr:Mu transposase C-terminal domain-containing protein [Kitasatospora kifunensis]MBB4922334.1 transposase InsO family protein [Kitasatospora kifunensis]MBB4924771.1 transposase InsO family protein [Kitasatospora kifunensis]
MAEPGGVLRVEDRVVFDGAEHEVVALSGNAVRLLSMSGQVSVVALPHLLMAADFAVVGSAGPAASRQPFVSDGLMDSVPQAAADRARMWERHLLEVETGLPVDAVPGAIPRPEYDPTRCSVAEREAAKASELTGLGVRASVRTVRRMRQRYRDQGLWGLVDTRYAPRTSGTGRVDPRVVSAAMAVINAQTGTSTGTKSRVLAQVTRRLDDEYGPGTVPLPSQRTAYRLLDRLAAGKHTFGSAVTRRQTANRPAGVFTPTFAARPGEQVQIDVTPLDVMAVMDDGVTARAELIAAIDIATRTICAAVLQPAGTKAIDASLLLARMMVPEPMRPGWEHVLRMSSSRIPHRRLVEIDRRLELAAAKPVIVPETVVIDHGKVFVSETFLRAARTLGVSVQPARPRTPTDKGVIERTFESINTLFCQHVSGYTGRDVTRRGADVNERAVWSVADLQELLEEWIVAGWQMRPHEGLRHPFTPDRALSPNEAYAALVAAAGYVPITLSGEDYIELLPTHWRAIGDAGVQIDYRTYNSQELAPYRHAASGIAAKGDRWEVHYDPYDLTRVWVRDHHRGGWITVPWTHHGLVRQPFADFTWRQARKIAAGRGVDDANETAVAVVLAALLRRAEEGPGQSRALSRARTATAMPNRLPAALPPAASSPPDPEPEPARVGAQELDDHADEPSSGAIVPFGLFDPFSEEGGRL